MRLVHSKYKKMEVECSLERRADCMANSLRCRFREGIRSSYNTRNLHLERRGLGCNSVA